MWIRLRQIALVAHDLRRAGLDIASVLGVEPCFTDPGVGVFGLKNTLWPVGGQFLEVVTPTQSGTAAGRYLDRRNGDGGYMVITQVDDVDRRRQRAAELGVRIAFTIDDPDHGHDGIQLHPADTGGAFFEMDQMVDGAPGASGPGGDDGDWRWSHWAPAGRHWQPFVRTDVVSAITAAELQSPDPEALARRWADIAELDLEYDGDENPVIQLDNASLRFVPDNDGRGEGLGGIDVAVVDRDAVLRGARSRGLDHTDQMVMVAGIRVYLR